MPSLRQLRAHFPALVIDAASARVQVGCLLPDGTATWRSSEAEAGTALFELVHDLPLRPDEAGCFIYCAGPGSILGIRTAAMAIRTWCVLRPRPVFSYLSLALVAHAAEDPQLQVIADARRDSWHCFARDRGLSRVPPAALSGSLAMPDGFRHWSALPPGTRSCPYDVGHLLARTEEIDLFHDAPSPDAFLAEEPTYLGWTPQVHRAPSPGSARKPEAS